MRCTYSNRVRVGKLFASRRLAVAYARLVAGLVRPERSYAYYRDANGRTIVYVTGVDANGETMRIRVVITPTPSGYVLDEVAFCRVHTDKQKRKERRSPAKQNPVQQEEYKASQQHPTETHK